METLYFDLVLFIYHLALALIVGGGIVLGSATAPALFRSIKSRGEAGAIFGAVLARWDGLAILCVILLVVTSVLRLGFETEAGIDTRLWIRWASLFVTCAGVLYASGWSSPVARSIRSQTPRWDELPDTAPARIEFAKMHRASTRGVQVAILAGLVAMFFS